MRKTRVHIGRWLLVIGTTGLLSLLAALAGCAASPTEIALTSTDAPASVIEPTPTGFELPAPTPVPTAAAGSPSAEDSRPAQLRQLTASWGTDWTKTRIDVNEILSGGPPRDGIPSIDDPAFVAIEEARSWLSGVEPVIALEIAGVARAYPLQILIWHEIVNDTVAGVPVVVTFCPLCNSAIAFDRRVDGETYSFGTSGLLRNSDLVMYDRTTESLWQQLTGEAIVGEKAGATLTFLPAALVSFDDFAAAYPEGAVLSRETGYSRAYGRNPYIGYDSIDGRPFLFDGELDGRLLPTERVVAVSIDGQDIAYPYRVLRPAGVINDTFAGQDLVLFHQAGAASALDDERISESADVGAAGVFHPVVDGQKLTFRSEDGVIQDDQTDSTWNLLGQAIAGPLRGSALAPIIHGNHFWFAWAAFKPETVIYSDSLGD